MKREEMIEKTSKAFDRLSFGRDMVLLEPSVMVSSESFTDAKKAEENEFQPSDSHIYRAAVKKAADWKLAGLGLSPDISLTDLNEVLLYEVYNKALRQWAFNKYREKYEFGEDALLLPFTISDSRVEDEPVDVDVYDVSPESDGPFLRIEGILSSNGENYSVSTALMTYPTLKSLLRQMFDDAEEIL